MIRKDLKRWIGKIYSQHLNDISKAREIVSKQGYTDRIDFDVIYEKDCNLYLTELTGVKEIIIHKMK